MVKTRTKAKVPIMDEGSFGENGKHVRMEINRKYMLAILLN